MSYDVYLEDPTTGSTVEFAEPHHSRGDTYVLGGTKEAWLNVTYNYSTILGRVIPGGIRSLYGKKAADTTRALEDAILALGNEVDPDYWKPTEGNVKMSLIALLDFAKARPGGVWRGD